MAVAARRLERSFRTSRIALPASAPGTRPPSSFRSRRADAVSPRPRPRTLILLYAADLAFRLRWQIRPVLEEGTHVIAAPYLETVVALRPRRRPVACLAAPRLCLRPEAGYLLSRSGIHHPRESQGCALGQLSGVLSGPTAHRPRLLGHRRDPPRIRSPFGSPPVTGEMQSRDHPHTGCGALSLLIVSRAETSVRTTGGRMYTIQVRQHQCSLEQGDRHVRSRTRHFLRDAESHLGSVQAPGDDAV